MQHTATGHSGSQKFNAIQNQINYFHGIKIYQSPRSGSIWMNTLTHIFSVWEHILCKPDCALTVIVNSLMFVLKNLICIKNCLFYPLHYGKDIAILSFMYFLYNSIMAVTCICHVLHYYIFHFPFQNLKIEITVYSILSSHWLFPSFTHWNFAGEL